MVPERDYSTIQNPMLDRSQGTNGSLGMANDQDQSYDMMYEPTPINHQRLGQYGIEETILTQGDENDFSTT